MRRVLVANQGWFRVRPGEPLTLSAFLRADAEGVAAQLAAIEAPNRMRRKQVTVGRKWQRHEFTFRPTEPFLFVAAGLDLEASHRDAATLWLDAIQLERGERADRLRATPAGGVVPRHERARKYRYDALRPASRWRSTRSTTPDSEQTVRGKLQVTDFFDRPAFDSQPTITLPPHAGERMTLGSVCKDRRGFFRANWTTPTSSQSLRCAIIDPMPDSASDSPLGFNHAYPWQFLVRLARQAGIVWWRDWSAKWQTVEPEKGRFDWTVADEQINRVQRAGQRGRRAAAVPVGPLELDRQAGVDRASGAATAATAATSCRWRLRRRI